jgi:amidohydrolase
MRIINSLILIICSFSVIYGQKDKLGDKIINIARDEESKYRDLYISLHQNPELSLMEFKTARKMADELESLGFEVTTGVGGNGVIGVFRNGKGKVILLRTDMDALPVKENTGLPFASNVIMKNAAGVESPVMHACGHDLHMSVWLGTLKAVVTMKSEWNGTIVAIAQPAEEVAAGSSAMIKDGLFKKFPKPDYALCYHVNAELPVGTIGYCPGPIFAGSASAEMTVYGIGGHGAMPHKTIDPIVLSAKIILGLQTIVSREINPVKPAVITVGSIHGGAKSNVIPDDVKMLLSLRFFDEDVYKQLTSSVTRIAIGEARTSGLPEDKMPLLKFSDEFTPPVVNDQDLVLRSIKYMGAIIGPENVIKVDPAMVAEDFGKYGLTEEKIPIALFWLGGVSPDKYRDHVEKGTLLPSLHNSRFVPDFDPAFRCGVSAMTRTIIGLLSESK